MRPFSIFFPSKASVSLTGVVRPPNLQSAVNLKAKQNKKKRSLFIARISDKSDYPDRR